MCILVTQTIKERKERKNVRMSVAVVTIKYEYENYATGNKSETYNSKLEMKKFNCICFAFFCFMITFLSFIFTLFLFFTLHTKTKYYYFYYLSPKTTRPSNRKKEDVNGNSVAATASILKISIKTSALKSINFPSFASTTAVIFFL